MWSGSLLERLPFFLALGYHEVMTETEQLVPLGMMAARLHRAVHLDCMARLQECGFDGLRMRHLTVFESLPREGARITALAADSGMSKQAMGELVDEIEASGYIERQVDPQDRRARKIVLTAKGEQAYQQAMEIVSRSESEYADLVGSDRYLSARATLDDLIATLESRP